MIKMVNNWRNAILKQHPLKTSYITPLENQGGWRDVTALRDLPKGVTRGFVMQYTTMTEKITSIHAYCWPNANSRTASC